MTRKKPNSEFLRYLAKFSNGPSDPERLPSLGKLSDEMGMSIAKLREQLEVARAFGFVEVRPRTGIRRKPFNFIPVVCESLLYALALEDENFVYFSELRKKVEAAFWCEAVNSLEEEDFQALRDLMESAWEKLNRPQIMIPHSEHRKLHMTIFSRLDNPFVQGILEAYWEGYEAVELNLYSGLEYLREVWDYHQKIVDAICLGDVETSLDAYKKHTELLRHRPY
jgi:DNA-binding FadR family transcriptional regulator